MLIEDPLGLQYRSFKGLNDKRKGALTKNKTSNKIKPLNLGAFGLLNQDNEKTLDNSWQMKSPKYCDIYKVIEIYKDGFALVIKCVSVMSVNHS